MKKDIFCVFCYKIWHIFQRFILFFIYSCTVWKAARLHLNCFSSKYSIIIFFVTGFSHFWPILGYFLSKCVKILWFFNFNDWMIVISIIFWYIFWSYSKDFLRIFFLKFFFWHICSIFLHKYVLFVLIYLKFGCFSMFCPVLKIILSKKMIF